MINTKHLREIAANSTRVVAWYPHSQYDGYHPGKASIRGPFGRWMLIEGGENEPGKLGSGVADLTNDAIFGAEAMNNLVPLCDEIDALRARIILLEEIKLSVKFFFNDQTYGQDKLKACYDAHDDSHPASTMKGEQYENAERALSRLEACSASADDGR